MNVPEEPIWVITVIYDRDTGEVKVDLGEMDPWSAHSLLESAVEAVWEAMPAATVVGADREAE